MRGPCQTPCATPAWGAWSLPTTSHPSHSTSLPVFPVSVAEGEAEVHRTVAEGVLRGTNSSSATASPHAVVQSSKRSVTTAVAPRTKSARSTRQVDSGHGFVMENFVHVHDVLEDLLQILSWNSVLYSWHSSARIKRGSGDAKILLDTEYDLRYFLFHKHGSTRVLWYFFIEGQGFCDLKANAGNAKCWALTGRGRSPGEDAKTVVEFALLFPSSELALQFKVDFDAARALNWERLGI